MKAFNDFVRTMITSVSVRVNVSRSSETLETLSLQNIHSVVR